MLALVTSIFTVSKALRIINIINAAHNPTWYWSTIKYCSRGTDQQSNTVHVVSDQQSNTFTWYWSVQSDTAHVVLSNNQILLTWVLINNQILFTCWSTIRYCSCVLINNQILLTWYWSVPHVSSITDCWSVPRELYLILISGTDQQAVLLIVLINNQILLTWYWSTISIFDCWSVPRQQYLIGWSTIKYCSLVLINNQHIAHVYWSTISSTAHCWSVPREQYSIVDQQSKHCSDGTDQQSNTAHLVLLNNQILLTWYWSTIKYCSLVLISTTWAVFDTDQYHVSSIWLLINNWNLTAHQVLSSNQILISTWYWSTMLIVPRGIDCWQSTYYSRCTDQQSVYCSQYHWSTIKYWSVPREQYLIVDQQSAVFTCWSVHVSSIVTDQQSNDCHSWYWSTIKYCIMLYWSVQSNTAHVVLINNQHIAHVVLISTIKYCSRVLINNEHTAHVVLINNSIWLLISATDEQYTACWSVPREQYLIGTDQQSNTITWYWSTIKYCSRWLINNQHTAHVVLISNQILSRGWSTMKVLSLLISTTSAVLLIVDQYHVRYADCWSTISILLTWYWSTIKYCIIGTDQQSAYCSLVLINTSNTAHVVLINNQILLTCWSVQSNTAHVILINNQLLISYHVSSILLLINNQILLSWYWSTMKYCSCGTDQQSNLTCWSVPRGTDQQSVLLSVIVLISTTWAVLLIVVLINNQILLTWYWSTIVDTAHVVLINNQQYCSLYWSTIKYCSLVLINNEQYCSHGTDQQWAVLLIVVLINIVDQYHWSVFNCLTWYWSTITYCSFGTDQQSNTDCWSVPRGTDQQSVYCSRGTDQQWNTAHWYWSTISILLTWYWSTISILLIGTDQQSAVLLIGTDQPWAVLLTWYWSTMSILLTCWSVPREQYLIVDQQWAYCSLVLINNRILLISGTDQQSNTAHVVLINNQILLTWHWSTIRYCSRGTDQQSNTDVALINN